MKKANRCLICKKIISEKNKSHLCLYHNHHRLIKKERYIERHRERMKKYREENKEKCNKDQRERRRLLKLVSLEN